MDVILADTRQHAGKHDEKHDAMRDLGFEPVYSKLYVGDYELPAKVSVDTKASIAELASNIDQQHDRFRRELVRAQEAGTKLYILVENADGVDSIRALAEWVEPDRDYMKRKNAKRRLYGLRLAKACLTMQEKYGCTFEFCAPSETGRRVLELLGVLDGSDS